MTFGVLLAVGVFLVFLAITVFLPVMVLVPQKFAICFTIGCALIIASFFALKGYRTQFAHMTSKEVIQSSLSFSLFRVVFCITSIIKNLIHLLRCTRGGNSDPLTY